MNNLWVFGDSFTAGWGCTPEFEYYKKYYKEGDKLWVELLADEMELIPLNIAQHGVSNDYIIDSIILNWKKIKQNDFVIIGKTLSHRFDIPIKSEKCVPVGLADRWVTILDKFNLDNGYDLFNKEEFETIINFNYHFASNSLYRERQDLRYNFLVKELEQKQIKVYLWDWPSLQIKLKFNTIQMDTNNEFIDAHFSFKGHVEFYKWISKKIKNENKII
jgi:lysophospholipase L1-like esterase